MLLDPHSEASEPDLDSKWSWKSLRREFKLSHSEGVFHLYQAKLQQSFFVALLILNIIFNIGAILSYAISKYHEMNLYLSIMRFSSILVFVAFLQLTRYDKTWMQSKFSRSVASLAVLMAMIFGEASGAICALVNDQATPLASIRRTYYLIITNHVFLPFPSRIQSCAATVIITSLEIIVTYISRRENSCRADYLTRYSVADIIFYASSAMIGFQITFLLEIAIVRTFLNHKKCIRSTYKLNYEKEKQEQLLRSCFPQHLIEEIQLEIRKSIARITKGETVPFRPFKGFYVKKYQDVTILYADIVNSMNLTDKLDPGELVETLNELYGRFDESAEKHSCLRIKLLGDCYYCVSGLPEYDEDHAIKCLLMGLEMIKIIQSIKSARNVDIDMRIGIHSGSVLSGILGLRKWQFDIWSLDAMKASDMEHSGQPGFVHITQRTLDLLPKGHNRLEDLIITATRQSDDSETTYLISERVSQSNFHDCISPRSKRRGQTEKLRAYIEKLRVRSTAVDFTQRRIALESSLQQYREIHEKVNETMKTAITEMPLGNAWKQFFFIDCLGHAGSERSRSHHNKLASQRRSNQQRSGASEDSSSTTNNDPRRRLSSLASVDEDNKTNCQQNRSRRRGGGPQRPQSQQLQQSKSADSKQTSRAKSNSLAKTTLMQTDPLYHLYLISVGSITLSILAIKVLIPDMPIYAHTVIGFVFLLAIIGFSTIYTQAKSRKIGAQFRILLWLIISASLILLQLVDLIVPDEMMAALEAPNTTDMTHVDSLSCALAWYYTFTIIVAMTATSIFLRINVWLKFIIHLSTIMFYIVINNSPASILDTLKEFLQTQENNWSLLDHKQELSHLFYIAMIAVILHLIDRQVEYILSLNIQWNEQLESDRIESETVGEINRILLENILPPHVLKRFLYNQTVNSDQLYHESHPSCAVLFASIPNYENFYSETELNEQGLKCLQVLNEIIGEFDELLSLPQFRDVEKIKTIGSTYMAACFDVSRRTSDCTLIDAQSDQPGHSPQLHSAGDLKAAWMNSLVIAVAANSSGGASPALNHTRLSSELGAAHFCKSLQAAAHPKSGVQQATIIAPLTGANQMDEIETNNAVTMVDFAMHLMVALANINRDAFQDFKLRIGISIGPVIAGVVGASKPTYDIWGDTVNVASRLESSGVLGRIHISEQVAGILERHTHWKTDCRGPIEVKGKGKLTTYLVQVPSGEELFLVGGSSAASSVPSDDTSKSAICENTRGGTGDQDSATFSGDSYEL